MSNVLNKLFYFRFLIGQYVTVHGDVISHVNISRVAVEDGGAYTCLVKNRAGLDQHSARLNIYGKILSRFRSFIKLFQLFVTEYT